MKYNIEDLQKIKKVEVPPYLYDKIRRRIEVAENRQFTTPVAWALSAAALLVLTLNVWLIAQTGLPHTNTTSETEILTQLFGTSPSNNIYSNE